MTVDETARQIWEWLPRRTDSRRVTLPATIAALLGLNVRDVTSALDVMERAGHVVRDRAIGRQSGWHRGTPLPALAVQVEPVAEEWPLF